MYRGTKNMHMNRRLVVGVLVLLAGGLLSVACGADPTPTPTATPSLTPAPRSPDPTATPDAAAVFQQEWEALIAAAQAEGEGVWVHSRGADRSFSPVIKAFGEKFGITVNLHSGSGRAAADRVLAERSAGLYTVDLFGTGGTTAIGRMVPGNFYDPVAPLLFHPDVLDLSNWYGGRHWYLDSEQQYVLIHSVSVDYPPLAMRYNTDLVSQEDIDAIESVFDYLNPKWKGMIAAWPPGPGGSSFDMSLHPQIGREWVERFMREMDVFWSSDSRILADGLAQGKFAIVMVGHTANADIDALSTLGLPVARLDKRLKEAGALEGDNGSNLLATANRPPHPNVQKLYINWFLSQEGQTLVNTIGGTEASPPAPSLRLDVPPGRTDPRERREAGVEYFWSVADDPEAAAAKRTEAAAFAFDLYVEITGQ